MRIQLAVPQLTGSVLQIECFHVVESNSGADFVIMPHAGAEMLRTNTLIKVSISPAQSINLRFANRVNCEINVVRLQSISRLFFSDKRLSQSLGLNVGMATLRLRSSIDKPLVDACVAGNSLLRRLPNCRGDFN